MKKKIVKTILVIIIALVVLLVGYLLYVLLSYSRIPDMQTLEIKNAQSELIEARKEHSIVTYNIGFGAYDQEYSFFLDTGETIDGVKLVGKHSKGVSKERTLRNTEGAIEVLDELDADIMLIQEVDKKSTRAHGINQYNMLTDEFDDHASVYSSNFHTAWLQYPIFDPIGKSESGLVTLSEFRIDSAVRRSYPVSDSLSKLFDLDRCFSVHELPVDNGKKLIVINSHMSAYDKGDVRDRQLQMITSLMKEEYEKGNYVIVGGDFNHVLGKDIVGIYKTNEKLPTWLQVLDNDSMPEGFSLVRAENVHETATCRSASVPFKKGQSYEATIDGFFISDNIKVNSAYNIETDYMWSDHQPVILNFTLL